MEGPADHQNGTWTDRDKTRARDMTLVKDGWPHKQRKRLDKSKMGRPKDWYALDKIPVQDTHESAHEGWAPIRVNEVGGSEARFWNRNLASKATAQLKIEERAQE